MTIGPYDSILNIKNFRSEWSSTVHDLTRIKPINPQIESLEKPETFNTRFQQLSQAVRHSFNAAADIAIRDKRYLSAFLAGYTNPIVSETFTYKEPERYTNVPSFNLNGMPIKFGEDRVMYSVSTLGTLNTAASYVWVFKNGILLSEDNYDMVNTAYGVKCFVKAEMVKPEDEVSVVINRIYNTDTKYREVFGVTSTQTTVSKIIPVDKFGKFYHIDYLKVMIKRGSGWITIPDENIVKELDVTGSNVKIRIDGFRLVKGDKLEIYNTIYFYELTKKIYTSASQPWQRTIPLVQRIAGEDRPVPFLSSNDFDVFINGQHLIPEIHYIVLEPFEEEDNIPKLYFLFDVPAKENVEIRIFKNEAVREDDSNYLYEKKIDDSGFVSWELLEERVPLMPTLGHFFAGGHYMTNKGVKSLQRNLIRVEKVPTLKEFYYQNRIIYTFDIKEVVQYTKENLNEYDQVLAMMGKDNVIQNIRKLYSLRDDKIESKGYKTFKEAHTNYTFDLDKGTIDNRVMATFARLTDSDKPVVLDANTLLSDVRNSSMDKYFLSKAIINNNQQ